jgi:hypothetical protein
VISGFHHKVDEICAVLGYYTPLSGSSVLVFRDSLLIPSSRVKKFKKKAFFLDIISRRAQISGQFYD